MIVLVVKIRSESGMHIKVLINMTLILFILAVFGASFIVTQSFLFERIRNLFNKYRYIQYLLSCISCFSFWMGVLIGIFLCPVNTIYIILNLFLCGCIGSGASTIIYNIFPHNLE